MEASLRTERACADVSQDRCFLSDKYAFAQILGGGPFRRVWIEIYLGAFSPIHSRVFASPGRSNGHRQRIARITGAGHLATKMRLYCLTQRNFSMNLPDLSLSKPGAAASYVLARASQD